MIISHCLVTLNRKDELIKNCRLTSPHVDRILVVDGLSTDGSIEWLQSEEARALKIEHKISKQIRLPKGNHTPKERNIYLKMASGSDWILISDTDEYIQLEGLQNLRLLIARAEQENHNCISFNAHDIWTYEDGQVYDNVSNYWNPMLYKYHPKARYEGHTHSHIVRPGMPDKIMESGFQYLHIKTERALWRNSTYLWWTTCKVADNSTDSPIWNDFHNLMNQHGFQDWHEFNKIMDAGSVPEPIKQWFINHKDADNPEERSWFIWYFIFLHPEQNINKIGNRDKGWDYLEYCKSRKANV